MENNINVKLSELDEGSLQQRFESALERVIKNILDLNTDDSKKRSIIMQIDFYPDEYREITGMEMSVKEKLVPQKAVNSRMVIDRDMTGEIYANEMLSKVKGQTRMNFDKGEVQTDMGQPVDEVEEKSENPEQPEQTESSNNPVIDFRKQQQG